MSFPDYVLNNSPLMRSITCKLFDHDATVYDLKAYDKLSPGLGKQIWQTIQKGLAEQTNPMYYSGLW